MAHHAPNRRRGVAVTRHLRLLAKPFQRFSRAATAHQHAIPGTRLGLALSKDIVEHHGGTIRIASGAGVGTTVTVTIPTADAPAAVTA